ncbi:hypothetical protein NliqN6_2948 [Naganishia liquefaciens]|uniref:Solute carrier family 40 member n=1 Tax=Naganishia liquefaciens TaxID=104408 RepID=A0A8H3YGB5_9TREE|nr:hypothetical protein NliqN6_2948 [Naganishia liquefaciens]
MPSLNSVPKAALACLLLQHVSSAWGEQSLEFAAYLFLITLYPYTFLPASALGLSITVVTVLASKSIGQQVDIQPRFAFVRRLILVQKLSQAGCYAIFLYLFSPALSSSPTDQNELPVSWPFVGLLVILASLGRIATTGIDLAVCRDWILSIAAERETVADSSTQPNELLTFLTTSLRRITLICKLLSPLLISVLTTSTGNRATAGILLGVAAVTLATEMIWIGVVWRKFQGVLARDEAVKTRADQVNGDEDIQSFAAIGQREVEADDGNHPGQRVRPERSLLRRALVLATRAVAPWNEFRKMPIFLSSISISCLYLTTLSFESILISYLKSEANLSDVFIAVARGISVAMGLLGTAVMPILEKKLGLVRAGAWSIWGEVASLVPVVLCLYIGPGPSATASLPSIINTLIFFATLSLSRLWLYCFDLVQLQALLVALERHPRRSEFSAMQVTMENAFDLAKYLVVLVFNKPDQYRWTAMISLVAVMVAGVTYSTYLYQVRGHVFHFGAQAKKTDARSADNSADIELPLLRASLEH